MTEGEMAALRKERNNNEAYILELHKMIEHVKRERDELRKIGTWIVREWFETPRGSSDLDQAISAMNALIDAKSLPPLVVRKKRDEGLIVFLPNESLIPELHKMIGHMKQERDEARSFAQGVYRWGPRAQWGVWERLMPWLKQAPKEQQEIDGSTSK